MKTNPMKGIYINLDRCSSRKLTLLKRIDDAGLSSSEYERFSGIEPVEKEMHVRRGLKSKGELGIFRSFMSVFSRISTGNFDDTVHVLEDDASFSNEISSALNILRVAMKSHHLLRTADIVFLDYFLDSNLFIKVAPYRSQDKKGSLRIIPASHYYLGCASSFLVRRSSATRLAQLLERIYQTSAKLAPIDLTFRKLLRNGIISAYMTVPLFCAPEWDQDEMSCIQANEKTDIRLSQRSHLLLRLLAAGIKTPLWCTQRLDDLHETQSGLRADCNAMEFLHYFNSLRGRMVSF